MENNNFEEVQLSNVWIKTHILDIIEELNQLQTIAKIGSLDVFSLSEINENEKVKLRLNALDLFEARIEVLKGNVFFGIEKTNKLKILLLLKQQNEIIQLCDHKQQDSLNNEEYIINQNFFQKLKILQEIKEILINSCAEKGWLLPRIDEELEEKTEEVWEDQDE